MGLDITAYEHVELAEGITIDALRELNWVHPLYDTDGIVLLYYAGFPERSDGLVEGLYRTSGECEAFAAGSYSGYNEWRESLAALVGTTPQAVWSARREQWEPGKERVGQPVPFVELIDFADNEGFIGPKTSAKLHADFVDHGVKAAEAHASNSQDDRWFLRKYLSFTKAFGLAARGGVVRFH